MTHSATTTCAPPAACDIAGRPGSLLVRLKRLLMGADDRAADRRNALVAFGIRVASAAILFVTQIALARWMGAEQFGIYVYAWTLVLVLGGIATAGLNHGAIRIVSELRERGAHDALRGFLRGGRLLVALVAFAITAIVLGLLWLVTARGVSGPWLTLVVIALALPAYALTDLQDGICRGCAWITSALLAPYIIRPLLILTGIGALFVSGTVVDATIAAGAAVAATWLAWAIQTGIVERHLRRAVPAGVRSYDLRAWTAVSAPLLLMSVFDLAMQNIDVIVISNLLTPADAGIYFAGAKTMALILFVHYAVGSAMSNRFAAISTRSDAAAMREAVRNAVRWTFWPSLALTVVMLAAGRHLLALFGPGFAAGYPVMCVLAIAIVARAAIGPAEALLNMTGGQADCARALMIAALANLVFSVLLTPVMGILGAAIAVAGAIILGAVLNWLAVRRRLGIDAGIWAACRRV